MSVSLLNSRQRKQGSWLPLFIVLAVLGVFASTVSVADAQVRRVERTDRIATPARVSEPETLRLACGADLVDGEHGVACRWSEATSQRARGYQLYRIVDGAGRELVATVASGERLGFFDSDLTAPSSVIYGVVAVNRAGRVIGQSPAVQVDFGQQTGELRLNCEAASIQAQRGVLCRWSEANAAGVRAYQLYRIVDGPRELIATVAADGRQGHFDQDITAGATHIYGVTAVDARGNVVAIGGPSEVRWPGTD